MGAHRSIRLAAILFLAGVLLAGLLLVGEPLPLSADLSEPPGTGKVTSIVPPPIASTEWLRAQGRPFPSLYQYKASPMPVQPRKLQGNVRLLAVLVDFGDNPATVTSNLAAFDNLIFALPVPAQGSVRDYYAAVSFGQVDLVTVNMPSSTGWQRAPQTYAYYVNNQYGWGSYPQNAGRMVEDLLPLVDPLVNFADYDNDGDGAVDSLLVIHAGTGAEFSLWTTHIWSHASSISMMGGSPQTYDGVLVDRYVTVPEYLDPGVVTPTSTDMTIGVICHEVAHGLWGLVDLYDLTPAPPSSNGIGQWGLMGYGTWNGPGKWNPYINQWVTDGTSPALPMAWSRLVAGFDTYFQILGPMETCLLAAETMPGSILRLKSTTLQPQEYFLLENRQQDMTSGCPAVACSSGTWMRPCGRSMAALTTTMNAGRCPTLTVGGPVPVATIWSPWSKLTATIIWNTMSTVAIPAILSPAAWATPPGNGTGTTRQTRRADRGTTPTAPSIPASMSATSVSSHPPTSA
jgi:M6 family metalloprotease-like protein